MRAKYIRKAKFLKKFGFFLWAPTPKDVKEQTQGGFWFDGGELGDDYDFTCKLDSKTALRRLTRRFGPPNNIRSNRSRRRFQDDHKDSHWEYLFLLDDEHWFSVYESHGKICIGYRFLVEDDVDFLRRKDFYAGDELCIHFCAFIRSIIEHAS